MLILHFCVIIDISLCSYDRSERSSTEGMAMNATATAPFPYDSVYTDTLMRLLPAGEEPIYQTVTSLPALTDSDFLVWRALEPALDKIRGDVERNKWNAPLALPARLEFFWNDEFTGVVIFDSRGRLIVHSPVALLGYDGSGPGLSKKILLSLGVSQEMFDEIQAEIWNRRPYAVVVSREKRTEENGIKVAQRTLDVESEWTWWRAR